MVKGINLTRSKGKYDEYCLREMYGCQRINIEFQLIAAVVESKSIRAAVRMTVVAKHTLVKLLTNIGRIGVRRDKAFQNSQD